MNLAFTDKTRGYFKDLTLEKMSIHVNEHFLNYFNPTKILINKIHNKGSIIFFNSIWSEISPNLENHKILNNLPSIPQSYSKSGLNGLMRQLAIELSSKKINVNCISPGYFPRVKVNAHQNISINFVVTFYEKNGKPNDLVGITLLLASEHSNYITGQNIIVDGGYTVI